MRKQKGLILGVALIAVVLMTVGYASIGNVPLTITGSASSAAAQDNFKVYYTGEATKSSATNVTTTITAKATTAKVDITGLVIKGDSEYAILEIENGSNAVDASSVEVTTNDTDTAIIDIEAVMCDAEGKEIEDYSVKSGSKTYVKVSATLLQTPTSDASADIEVTLTAIPKAVN